MLIDFAITNFRSIKERQVFSMQTVSRINEKGSNTIQTNKEMLLRSAVIYGRNASGKSNLLLAADYLYNLVYSLFFELPDMYEPFKLCINKTKKPVVFELNFYSGSGKKYNYYLSYTDKEIIEENLYYFPEGKRARLYLRNSKEIKTEITGLKDIWNNTYSKNTVLSRVNFHKIDALTDAFHFFRRHFVTKSFIGDESSWEEESQQILEREQMPFHIENLSKLLKIADTGIESIEMKKIKPEEFNFPETIDKKTKEDFITKNSKKLIIKHPVFENGEKVGYVDFDLDEESAGTRKLLLFGSNMLDCLSDGDVLFIDELDKGLHPKLMQAIIRVFNNPKTNPNNAQLIITTHDISLLGADLFRRDQIWISEKDTNGISSYYTLADVIGIRAEVPFDKYYMKGAFGGSPILNDYDFEFNLERTDEKL